MNRDIIYMHHIVESVDKIDEYLEGDLRLFLNDSKTYHATIRLLQVLAESTQRISEETQKILPQIEWQKIKSFRNILVHDYLGDLNDEIVLSVIKNHLPIIKSALVAYLKEQGETA